MRLPVSLLLVALALCCYEADATVCPAVVTQHGIFFLGSSSSYKDLLQTYNPPPEVLQSKMELKECVDQISYSKKAILSGLMGKVVLKCTLKPGE